MTNFQRGYGEQDSEWNAGITDGYLTRGEADRKALRSFWRGACFGAVLAVAAFIGSAAWSQTTQDWGGSSATIRYSESAALAEVECVNELTSGGVPVVSFTLILDGIAVAVTVEQGPGKVPDTYTITPPPGFTAVPPSVSVAEHDRATVLIFLNDGGLS